MRTWQACSLMMTLVLCSAMSHAQDGGAFYGLLRMRDLTPFGSLRLDMRPAHAVAIEPGSFAIETELGYQNPHYFIKVFKKHFGLTPQEYRNTKA